MPRISPRPRKPTFNGLQKELARLRKGKGLAVGAIEKINTAHQLLFTLSIAPMPGESDVERAIRSVGTLREFIYTRAGLNDDEKDALTIILNLDNDAEWRSVNLEGRREDLERKLGVGRRKVNHITNSAERTLILKLMSES